MSDEVLFACTHTVKNLRARVAQSGVCINNCVSSSSPTVRGAEGCAALDCCITVGKKWDSLANGVLRLAGAGGAAFCFRTSILKQLL